MCLIFLTCCTLCNRHFAYSNSDSRRVRSAILYEAAIDNINPKFKDVSSIGDKPRISSIFKDIPTTFHLTEIKILRYDHDDNDFNFDWDNLSQILAQPQFSALQSVSVIIKHGYSRFSRSRKNGVLEQMSDLYGRGILNVFENDRLPNSTDSSGRPIYLYRR